MTVRFIGAGNMRTRRIQLIWQKSPTKYHTSLSMGCNQTRNFSDNTRHWLDRKWEGILGTEI